MKTHSKTETTLSIVSTLILFSTLLSFSFSACSSGTTKDASHAKKADQPITGYIKEKQEQVKAVEKVAAENFVQTLNTAAQQYVLVAGKYPSGFSDFVAETNGQSEKEYTTNVASLGRSGGCDVDSNEINCDSAFKHFNVKYIWHGEGKSTAEISAK